MTEQKDLTFDSETTGLVPKKIEGRKPDYKIDFDVYPRIVSLAYKINDDPTVEHIINQEGFHIPEEATKIHGITNEMAEASDITIKKALALMSLAGGGCTRVIAHNLYFDSSIIKANLLRLKEVDLYDEMEELLDKDKRYDTMQKTTKFCQLPNPSGRGGYKWPKLEELYMILFDGEKFPAHNAAADVDATYRCFLELIKRGVIQLREGQE